MLEFLGNVMMYVIIDDRLLEALSVNSQDAKMSELEYHIANVKP